MKQVNFRPNRLRHAIRLALAFPMLGGLALPAARAADITVNVVSPDASGGLQEVTGFRWLLQENATYDVVPGVSTIDMPSLKLHKSEAPVIASGYEDSSTAHISGLDPSKRYFVSVLPYADHAQNGGFVNSFVGSNADLTVQVNRTPIPTTQMSIQACEDMEPINNVCDPAETPLANFTVTLTDAGGMYGYGGQVLEDAFGNPLGTTYQFNPDGTPVMNPDGTPVVVTRGSGIIKTNARGEANIKYLAPGKYTAQVIPPAGAGWMQTNTIEGGKGIDGWLQAKGQKLFWEFGLPLPHASFAFVNPAHNNLPTTGGSTVTGRVMNVHSGRPPLLTSDTALPFPDCWVGLTDNAGQVGRWVGPCNADSTFSIPHVPAGSYDIMTWDANNDSIVGFFTVTVPAGGGTVAMGDMAVNDWFFHAHNYVFRDTNDNGVRDPGEPGIPSRGVDIRFRDGRIFQLGGTDLTGFFGFDEAFPFFNWLIAEVDYTNLKATGATITTDAGGIIPADGPTFGGRINPQVQPDGSSQRTETSGSGLDYAPVLLEAFQGFAGQTQVIEWGKKPYNIGENGGIAGIVYYATTRAEDDARYAVADQWEPGIPRVQVNLYKCLSANGSGCDVPAGRMLVNAVTTDSWDDNPPTECVWDQAYNGALGNGDPFTFSNTESPFADTNCFDGLRVWNQVRPGVFDGGYMFTQEYPSGGTWNPTTQSFEPNNASEVQSLRQPQYYVIEVVPPAGYELVKEEDKNVELGDAWQPSPLAIPPQCVGDSHTVPPYLSMQSYPDGTVLPGVADPIAAPFAGQPMPLCDKKKVRVTQGSNTPADFFLFTQVPKAAMVTGQVLNDVANAFVQTQPNFGEKAAAEWIPISLRDWTGAEFGHMYTDEFGKFNFVMPTTHNANIPQPSGLSPAMLSACMNDPGTTRNPAFDPTDPQSPPYRSDPFFNPYLTHGCFILQYIPGATTYLDTPVANNAAFAGQGRNYPADCEQSNAIPAIYSVISGGTHHPGSAYAWAGETVTLTSMGTQQVPNPRFGAPGEPATIARDFGFGNTRGTLTLGGSTVTVSAANWNNNTITFTVPTGGSLGPRQILVTRSGGGTSAVGATLIVGKTTTGTTGTNLDARVREVRPPAVLDDTPIQDAIDTANPGDIVLIFPGAYDELPVMHKPLQIQGSGAPSTVLNAQVAGGAKLARWQAKIDQVVAATPTLLLSGQTIPVGGRASDVFANEVGGGFLVLGKQSSSTANLEFSDFTGLNRARIDGLSFTGAQNGGAIFVNGNATNLEIANNRLTLNQGSFGGGIRIGHPTLTANGTSYVDAQNTSMSIHHNHIAQNGSSGGAGGGISLYTGTNQYSVANNFVCGNFTLGDGGGIGQSGRAASPATSTNYNVLQGNTVVFNQSFNQQQARNGGGIYVGGAAPLGTNTVTEGTGSLRIDGNYVQGNQAGTGEGGGLRIEYAHGLVRTYRVEVTDNMVVNNVSGMGGAGMSFQDVIGSGAASSLFQVVHNTVVNNDSTATAAEAFDPGNTNLSLLQPAGLVSHNHSPALITAGGAGAGTISNPNLRNNIIWHNRSFRYCVGQPGLCDDPNQAVLLPDIAGGDAPIYSDLAVIGSATALGPVHNVLSSPYVGGSSNSTTVNPVFVSPVVNGQRETSVNTPYTSVSNIEVAPSVAEGANAIDVRYGPLTRFGWNGIPLVNYHLAAGNPTGANGVVNRTGMTSQTSGAALASQDFDNVNRTATTGQIDVGADER